MVKQKIATITFHRARNYGAVLQAVALQKAIIGLGYDSEVIDYDNRIVNLVRVGEGKSRKISMDTGELIN